MSADMLQKCEANNLMKSSDNKPNHLPTENALRISKFRAIDDPVLALCKTKHMHPYLNTIKDIGYDQLFVHY